MVNRPVPCGAQAVSGRCRLSSPALVLGAVLWAASTAPAQQQPATPPASTPTPPAATPAPPAAAVTQPAKEPAVPATFGKIIADTAPLRCWSGAVAAPPVFEESLVKDQVVGAGRSENGFRAVLLPFGPVGYVSKKFTEATADGRVKTKGTKVAFRYRPRSSEAPVSQLEEGAELHIVGEHEDWYRVRVPGVEAWVAEAEIAVGDQTDPALAKGWAELRGKHEAEVKARLDQIAARIQKEKQDAIDLAAVQLIEDAFTAERKKPIGEQRYDGLSTALDKLLPTLAADSAARGAIDGMKKRIQTQTFIAEATALRDSQPPPVDLPAPPQKDELERFQSIGWLRYERRLAGPGLFYLEKGGQRQYVLSCNTGRYDLSLLVDREVGVIGPRRRPAADNLSVLDVERIEVLGTPAK